MAAAENSQVVAKGSLAERPLPRLIQQLFRKRVTGCLVIIDESGDESRVFMREGAPVHVIRPNDVDRLDRVLVDTGVLTKQQVAELRTIKEGGDERFGEVLISHGFMTAEVLADVLKNQMRRKLTRLFFAQEGTFQIYTDPHSYGEGPEFAAMRIDPRCLLYPGIRAAYDSARLLAELAPLVGRSFRLMAKGQEFLEAMGLSPKDAITQALQRGPLTLETLATIGTKVSDARAAVLALFYADLLETETAAAASPPEKAADAPPFAVTPPVVPSAPPVVAASPAMRTTPAIPSAIAHRAAATTAATTTAATTAPKNDPALRAKILELAGKLDQLSHFEVLNVPENAQPGEISAAYMRAVRQLHPDRLAGAGLGDLAKQAERIMARMSEASAIMADPKKRAEYLDARAGKPPPVDPAVVLLQAEEIFKKGEACLKKGDYARAVEAFAEAREKNPEEPEYRAYWAWARFEAPGAAKGGLAKETLAIFEEVAKQKQKFPLVSYWSGQVWKSLGETGKAEAAFRDALVRDKAFIDAEREIRLIVMRRQKGGGPAPGATAATPARPKGLFDKFLKK